MKKRSSKTVDCLIQVDFETSLTVWVCKIDLDSVDLHTTKYAET